MLPPNDLPAAIRRLYPPDMMVLFRAIDKARKRASTLFDIRHDPVMNRNGWDFYFGVQPRSRRQGTADAVPCYVAILGDFDDAQSAARALEMMEGATLPPSIVVASGSPGAIQTYHLLDRPEPVQKAQHVAQAWCTWTHSDAVHDPPRIMRVPGTRNWKPGAGVATIEQWHPERRYALGRLAAACGASERGLPAHKLFDDRQLLEDTRGEGGDPIAALPPRLRELMTRTDRCTCGRARGVPHSRHDGFPSRSERDLAITRSMLLGGATPRCAYAALAGSPAGDRIAEERQRGREDYYRERLLARASAALDTTGFRTYAIERVEVRPLHDGNTSLRVLFVLPPSCSGGVERFWAGWIRPRAGAPHHVCVRWAALAQACGVEDDLPSSDVMRGALMRCRAIGVRLCSDGGRPTPMLVRAVDDLEA